MVETINKYLEEVSVFKAENAEDIESFRIKYLGQKGVLKQLFLDFKTIPSSDKKVVGQMINTLKQKVQEKITLFEETLVADTVSEAQAADLTLPGYPFSLGSQHPISAVRDEVVAIFSSIGFGISEGPEIEDDWHNFTALNLPEDHPARDMQDTFFVQTNPDMMLRTHTSSVQIRHMTSHTPPIRTLSPGRVYRNEDISARSHCLFHQIEGLYVDKKVSFVDLKQVLSYFTDKMFGKSKIRLRPSYFPFTEPSAELDIYWGLNNEDDYRITKGTGWLEIMGCGMVDPNVLQNCGIDPQQYSGYAFGMGLERMAMLLYGITDIRDFFENDVRLLRQFRTACRV